MEENEDYRKYMVEAAKRRKQNIANIEHIKLDLSSCVKANKLDYFNSQRLLLVKPPKFMLDLAPDFPFIENFLNELKVLEGDLEK